MSDSKRQPAKSPGKSIVKVFNMMVSEMCEVQHEFAVDVEINFKTVTIDRKGLPLISKNTTQSQLEIKLATRIIPSVSSKEIDGDGVKEFRTTEPKNKGHSPDPPF
jgi:hypothetical protein